MPESFFVFSTRFHKYKFPKKVKKHPHELDSKLRRAMINLAGLTEGDTICDPFCGSGTTLLEAEAMVIHSIGIDFDEKMYHIARQNLASNGFNSKIIRGDYTQLQQIRDKIDGVVTYLPYGKNSKLFDIYRHKSLTRAILVK
jgi:tRNA (guanine10-N2)-dimethyltransferase